MNIAEVKQITLHIYAHVHKPTFTSVSEHSLLVSSNNLNDHSLQNSENFDIRMHLD